jgi:uncharacterized protein YndB with AHSA1/START domain
MPRDILLGLEIDADAHTIFEAITTKEGLSTFWTSDVVAEPEVGSEARFGFAAAPVPLRMRVEALDPDREVGWTCVGDFPNWADTRVTWSLTDGEQAATRLLFRHVGFPDEQAEYEYASVSYTWAMVLARLKELAESGSAQPALG